MSTVLDLLPVFQETLARIRARMDADVNAGLDPTDPDWIDPREGSFYWDMSQVAALELARVWDALASETVAAAFPSTAWGDYLDEHAATFGLTRNPAVAADGAAQFSGTDGTFIPSGVQVSAEPADPSLDAVTFVTTASGTLSTSPLSLPITAVLAGSAGNLGAGAITNLDTVIPGLTDVTNPTPTSGGVDVEDDEALRRRVLAQYKGQAAGTQNWYVQQALAFPGVQRAVCVPVWGGPGTVLVVAMLADGSPVALTVVTGLQTLLDPVAGQGHGLAPVGATVTVSTTVPLAINIVATIAHEAGFTLDGAGGTIPTRAAIVAALNAYVAQHNPGDTLIFQQVLATFFSVDGVSGVSGLTVNGGTSNVSLGVSPAQYAVLNPPTLS